MLVQLPEEKKDSIIPLFKKTQPNRSALGCYFNGTMRCSKHVVCTAYRKTWIYKSC